MPFWLLFPRSLRLGHCVHHPHLIINWTHLVRRQHLIIIQTTMDKESPSPSPSPTKKDDEERDTKGPNPNQDIDLHQKASFVAPTSSGMSQPKETSHDHRRSSSSNLDSVSIDEPEDKEESNFYHRLAAMFEQTLKFGDKKDKGPEPILKSPTVDGIVEYMKSGRCHNIIVLVGAGISTSAGIPDFRSPGSGLYANLAQYKLPYAEAIFDIDFFKKSPEPFFHLAKKLMPSADIRPTPSHHFLRLLHEKGLLKRIYTQNIDTLEREAGIPDEKLVEAHGSFSRSHCLRCGKAYDFEYTKSQILNPDVLVMRCPELIKGQVCKGVIKPDIVFFGENLPKRFFHCSDVDFDACDFAIIMGTSLQVQPFCSLVQLVPPTVPRLVINLDKLKGNSIPFLKSGPSFAFGKNSNTRDVFMEGKCDEMTSILVEKLGWNDPFNRLLKGEPIE